MNCAYILCGGFGTRLHSVTQGAQKAIVDIDGEPFLMLILLQLRLAGINQCVLCAHYRAEQLIELLPSLTAKTGLHLEVVIEAQPLGTGGALLHALNKIPPTRRYLALNADTFVDHHAYHLALSSPQSLVVSTKVEDCSRYGRLVCDQDGRVSSLQEKSVSGAGLINAGVYGFNVATLDNMTIQPCSMEHDLLPLLVQQQSLFTREYIGPFIDIGTPESLAFFKSNYREVYLS